MSFRSCLARVLLRYSCLLSVGAAGYMVVQTPFAASRLKQELIEGTPENIRAAEWAGDPLAIRVCEELIADPLWFERLPGFSQDAIIEILDRVHSDALAPALRDFLANWNRQPNLEAQEVQTPLAYRALLTLLKRSTASKRKAMEQLEQEFPPFPRPYRMALPASVQDGKARAVMALTAAVIAEARRIPDAQATGWARSRSVLEDLRHGLASIPSEQTSVRPELAEAKDRLWEIFAIQFRDGERHVGFDGLHGGDSLARTRALFFHLPELPAINQRQIRSFHFLDRESWPPEAFTTVFAEWRAKAGGDLRRIHWLKKLMVLEVLRRYGTEAELPFLVSLRPDQSAMRTLVKVVKEGPNGAIEERQQDADAPIPPGWQVARVESFGQLADKVWIDIRARTWVARLQEAVEQAQAAAKAARSRSSRLRMLGDPAGFHEMATTGAASSRPLRGASTSFPPPPV